MGHFTFTLLLKSLCDPTCMLCSLECPVSPVRRWGQWGLGGVVCGRGLRRALLVIFQTCDVCLTVRISLNIYIYITVYSSPPRTHTRSLYLHICYFLFHASSAPTHAWDSSSRPRKVSDVRNQHLFVQPAPRHNSEQLLTEDFLLCNKVKQKHNPCI